MPHAATITGKTGPDRTLTAAAITNVSELHLNLVPMGALQIKHNTVAATGNQPASGPVTREIDLGAVATITLVKTGADWAITVA